MKKYKTYLLGISLLIIGLGLGFWIAKFNDSKTSNQVNKEEINKGENHIEHWTCSMHPQIDMPKPGKCPICGMDLIPKKESGSSENMNVVKMTENAIRLASVQTMKVGERDMARNSNLKLSGKIAVNTDYVSVQAAHFGGRIEKLYFQNEGDYINKGDLVALIYSPELVTAQNELLEAYYIKNEQPELYRSVRRKLKNWKISEKLINQIENTKKVMINFPMYADKSGYIKEVKVETGNHVKEGTPMYKLSDLKKVWAVLDVYEKDLSKIKVGQTVKLAINAIPEKQFYGKIIFISPILDDKTRTAEVRVNLNNTQNKFKPGMLLEGELVLPKNKQKSNILIIPKSAILWTGKRSVVYVKTNPDLPEFELREVELGKSFGENYQILKGLQPEDEIVVNGAFIIDATAQLQGKKSMMGSDNKPMKMNHKM